MNSDSTNPRNLDLGASVKNATHVRRGTLGMLQPYSLRKTCLTDIAFSNSSERIYFITSLSPARVNIDLRAIGVIAGCQFEVGFNLASDEFKRIAFLRISLCVHYCTGSVRIPSRQV